VARILGWTLLSAVVPGSAHLRVGLRRTGLVLLSAYAVVLLGVLALALTADATLAGRLTSSAWLTTITVAAAVLGIAWFTLVVHSFMVLRPGSLPTWEQILSGVIAGVLAVTVLLPFALAAQYVVISQRTLDEVFDAPPEAEPQVRPDDPWNGRTRVNILLLGGDADDHRPGVRTDSINVASVDVASGNTVLFSLPRNLENVRFPPGTPMHERFPEGFRLPANPDGSREDLLFSVWEYADQHPEIFGGRRHQGATTLKEAVGYTLGLEIDWYALVNMWGFARLIDALGGITVTVDQDVVFGRYNEGLVKAGTRRLRGADAMWFARSRTFSDDFTRMRRQRCVMGALLEQADPATVLTRFNQVALATKELLRTDIPRPMLEHLVPLGIRVKNARVTSVQFVPPLINTGYPDWIKIRTVAAKAINDSVRPHPATGTRPKAPTSASAPATATPRSTATPRQAAPRPTGSGKPAPSATGTPDPAAAVSIDEGCHGA
jgi:LCP family protein required for cell wall assembly